jgi:hypothetical protein
MDVIKKRLQAIKVLVEIHDFTNAWKTAKKLQNHMNTSEFLRLKHLIANQNSEIIILYIEHILSSLPEYHEKFTELDRQIANIQNEITQKKEIKTQVELEIAKFEKRYHEEFSELIFKSVNTVKTKSNSFSQLTYSLKDIRKANKKPKNEVSDKNLKYLYDKATSFFQGNLSFTQKKELAQLHIAYKNKHEEILLQILKKLEKENNIELISHQEFYKIKKEQELDLLKKELNSINNYLHTLVNSSSYKIIHQFEDLDAFFIIQRQKMVREFN